MPPAVQTVLEDVFGFRSLRPGQAEIIEAVLNGQHVLGVMPTGAGKSLCYQLPALVKGGLTLVVSPLVALMDNQVTALQLSGVAAEALHANRSRDENTGTWRQAASGRLRLLYMAPERLMQPWVQQTLQDLPVSLIAIDEAHCISRWGPAFRPDYERLTQLGTLFPEVPIAAFTATADPETRRDICDKLFNRPPRVFSFGFDRPNIHLAVRSRTSGTSQLLSFVQRQRGESGIVYCLSRKGTESTTALLQKNGIPALPYHAGLDADMRLEHQQIFMTKPGSVMVATIAFGMGIDKPDIRYVFHCNLPANLEAYYQEIGRAGRDGEPAQANMLYGLDDIGQRRRFIEQSQADEEFRRREHQRLDMLLGYCEGVHCRREPLLGAFGEHPTEPCGNCDNCRNPPEVVDGLTEAQKVLSAAHRTGQRFGAAHLTDIVTGSATAKVRERRHDQLPTFGVGQDRGKTEWRSIIRQMVAGGLLAIDLRAMGGLAITRRGRELLAGREGFSFRRDTVRAIEPRSSGVTTPRPAATEELVDGTDQALFDHLRELRLVLAKERKVPAYVIFTDRTLREMARCKPRNEGELLAVHGVGSAKIAQFGSKFLEAIAAFEGEGQGPLTGLEGSPEQSATARSIEPEPSGTTTPSPTAAEEPADKTDQALFEHLRELRLALAKERNVFTYVVFPDRTLREMARHKPRDEDELLAIHGVGNAKVARYGLKFLEAIAAFEGEDQGA